MPSCCYQYTRKPSYYPRSPRGCVRFMSHFTSKYMLKKRKNMHVLTKGVTDLWVMLLQDIPWKKRGYTGSNPGMCQFFIGHFTLRYAKEKKRIQKFQCIGSVHPCFSPWLQKPKQPIASLSSIGPYKFARLLPSPTSYFHAKQQFS